MLSLHLKLTIQKKQIEYCLDSHVLLLQTRKYSFSLTVVITLLQEKPDGQKYTYECQHGEKECLGNMIEVTSGTKHTHGAAKFKY